MLKHITAIAILAAMQATAQTPGCYTAEAEYVITPPEAVEEIVYHITLAQSPAPGDTLSPVNYLIRWRLVAPERFASEGFTAYSDGHLYIYRPVRLQEYHAEDDPAPFTPGGDTGRGIQRTARFTDMLPGGVATLKAETDRGDGARTGTVVIGADGAPVSFDIVYNQGQASEQTVSARYTDTRLDTCVTVTEDLLRKMYPEAFELYRRDSYSLMNLPGRPLPTVQAPGLDGKRWSHRAGDPFPRPTLIALLDTDVDSTPEVIAQLRAAMDSLPFAADLILTFTGNDLDAIATATGTERTGETVLHSARALARDCGVTDSPSMIFCRPDGTVADIHIGRNNELRPIVIQKMSSTR